MEELYIRRATPEDVATLEHFEQGMIHAERPFDPVMKPDPIRYYDFPAMFAHPDLLLLIAEWEGKPVGCGFARIEAPSRKYLKHDLQGYLGFMYVEPEFRGKGINRTIIDELKKWVAGYGISELRLFVYPGNEAAVKAYEKAGFSHYLSEMRLEL